MGIHVVRKVHAGIHVGTMSVEEVVCRRVLGTGVILREYSERVKNVFYQQRVSKSLFESFDIRFCANREKLSLLKSDKHDMYSLAFLFMGKS